MLNIKPKENLSENSVSAPNYNNKVFTHEYIYDKYESVKNVILSSFLKVLKEYENYENLPHIINFLNFHKKYKYLYLIHNGNIKILSDYLFDNNSNKNFEFVATFKKQFYFDYCIDSDKEKDLIEFVSLCGETIKDNDFNEVNSFKENNGNKRNSNNENLNIIPFFYLKSGFFYSKEWLMSFIKANTFILPLILLQLSVEYSDLDTACLKLLNIRNAV